jgi:DNA-directed RNA polymerase specialized sigma24 family protein
VPSDGVFRASEEAWLALVERFAGLVWSVPRGLGLGTGPAMEVAQTAWLRLVEQLDAVTDPPSWLLRVTRAEAVRAARWHEAVPSRSADDALAALDALPARTRLAVRVLAAGGDEQALAAALDVTQEEAGQARESALARLVEELGDDGLARVRSAVERADAPPAALLAAAREAHSWRTLDAELAPLTDDGSRDVLAGVRGAPVESRLVFRTAHLRVDVEVSSAGTTRSLLGQLTPAGPAVVVLRLADGSRSRLVCDDDGRFAADAVPAGTASLRVERPGAPPVHTDWVAL